MADFYRSTAIGITIFIHVCCEALVKSTGSALIPVSFINRTAVLQFPLSLAGVNPIAVDAALKEPGTALI